VLIFYFLSRSIVAPVTRLAVTARHVAKGDLKLRVRPDTLPETRELGLAFNAMLDSVESGQTALKEANEEIIRQKTLAELGKFSLMVAHEVKNPLSIIKSSMDLLKKEIRPLADKTPVVYIEDEIQRLNQLIEDFLLFARPAVPAFREVDLNAMLKEIVDRFDVQMNGSPVSTHADIPDTPCWANADPDLLTRAIGNILKNAVEASGRMSSIEVRAVQKGDNWVVECEDDGPGITQENLKKIFDPFFTTRSRGTGLGLTFVSQVLTAHRGNIRAENLPDGKGARFILELPLKQQKNNEPHINCR
jgi:signal transduction histidine kinase